MEIPSIVSARQGFGILKIIVVSLLIINVGLVTLIIYGQRVLIDEGLERIFLIDTNGNVQSASIFELDIESRKAEFVDHVSDFYTLFYSFDQNSFEDNVNKALFLIGSKGNELAAEYSRENVLSELRRHNTEITVEIQEILIDMSVFPARGIIRGIQTSSIEDKSISRRLDAEFTIGNLRSGKRTVENSHAALILDWRIVNNQVINNKR